jgi:hypothetical protein
MTSRDRRPLADAPAADLIREHADNRLGAVYSALYSFWSARHAAITAGQQGAGVRHDAYSVVLFSERTTNVLVNDFTRTPDQLLDIVLEERPSFGTNFSAALGAARAIMEQHWTTERLVIRSGSVLLLLKALPQLRMPIMIFLSDGAGSVSDELIRDVCRSAVGRG